MSEPFDRQIPVAARGDITRPAAERQESTGRGAYRRWPRASGCGCHRLRRDSLV